MIRALVVDDSNFMRHMMKQVLTANGYEIAGEAENGKIALEKYKELSPDFVTLDITMNEVSGLDALKDIIEYDKDAKIIMVSAMGQPAFVKEAIVLGAKGFIIKPLKEEAIMAAVSRLFKENEPS